MTITKISISTDERLFVYPQLGEGEDFRYVYRAARGVYWDSDVNALYAQLRPTNSFTARFVDIVEAAAAEYGRSLVLREDTEWENVPTAVRDEIAGRSTGRSK